MGREATRVQIHGHQPLHDHRAQPHQQQQRPAPPGQQLGRRGPWARACSRVEYPNPLEILFPSWVIYAQNAGNEVKEDTFEDNGYLASPHTEYLGDVAFEGGFYGTKRSANNCASGNTMPDGSFPEDVEWTWGCQNPTTPDPTPGDQRSPLVRDMSAGAEGRIRAQAVLRNGPTASGAGSDAGSV